MWLRIWKSKRRRLTSVSAESRGPDGSSRWRWTFTLTTSSSPNMDVSICAPRNLSNVSTGNVPPGLAIGHRCLMRHKLLETRSEKWLCIYE